MKGTLSLKQMTQRISLRRLEYFLDIAYAVLFVNFIMYLPKTEDMDWLDLRFGLFSLLAEHFTDLIRLVIAVGLTLVSWGLTHKLLAPLERTNGLHTLMVLLQLTFVCFFLFFAIADPFLVSVTSPLGQSISLAISGFIGIASWAYARKQGLVKKEVSDSQKDEVSRSIIIEPITATLNSVLSLLNPVVWSLGWFIIPLLLIGARHRLEKRR